MPIRRKGQTRGAKKLIRHESRLFFMMLGHQHRQRIETESTRQLFPNRQA